MKFVGMITALREGEKRRYIDFLKGVAIIMMLWGHTIQYLTPESMDFFDNSLYKIIYSFHMPVLMVISGYLYSFSVAKYDFVTLIHKKVSGLLWPLAVWSVLNYYITTGVFNILLGRPIALFNGEWLYNLSSLWFIWSVFSASVAVALLYRITNIWMRIIGFVLSFILVALFPNAVLNLYMYPFFLIGFAIPKINDAKKVVQIIGASMVLYPIGMIFFQKDHFIYTQWLWDKDYSVLRNINIDLYRYSIAILGCCFFAAICFLIFKHSSPTNRIVCLVERMGKKSLQIYMISVGILSGYLPKIAAALWNFWGGTPQVWVINCCISPILTMLFIGVILGIIHQIERNNASKILFGR